MSDNSRQAEEGLLVITFLLGDAAFGIDTHQVQEVARLGDVTPVHNAPTFVVGIRNLRGRIVTVIDLRARLELGQVVSGPDNRILIAEWQGEPIGMLVDSVGNTISTRPEDLLPAPPNLHDLHSRSLRGVCRSKDRLVAVLDLGVLFPEHEENNVTSSKELAAA